MIKTELRTEPQDLDDADQGLDPQVEGLPGELGMDPIQEAIDQRLGTDVVLRRIVSTLARMQALLGWIQENPDYYSITRQVEICQAMGRQQRALRVLVDVTLSTDKLVESEIPPGALRKVLALLMKDTLTVLGEVVAPELAQFFEDRLCAAIGTDEALAGYFA